MYFSCHSSYRSRGRSQKLASERALRFLQLNFGLESPLIPELLAELVPCLLARSQLNLLASSNPDSVISGKRKVYFLHRVCAE